mmetsp:Transcript_11359/g.33718  ORF Transcript_11359/g.33718 Transcript_11359/m.33718 type:complete len:299 (+) Transcript_11359:78-974(+)
MRGGGAARRGPDTGCSAGRRGLADPGGRVPGPPRPPRGLRARARAPARSLGQRSRRCQRPPRKRLKGATSTRAAAQQRGCGERPPTRVGQPDRIAGRLSRASKPRHTGRRLRRLRAWAEGGQRSIVPCVLSRARGCSQAPRCSPCPRTLGAYPPPVCVSSVHAQPPDLHWMGAPRAAGALRKVAGLPRQARCLRRVPLWREGPALLRGSPRAQRRGHRRRASRTHANLWGAGSKGCVPWPRGRPARLLKVRGSHDDCLEGCRWQLARVLLPSLRRSACKQRGGPEGASARPVRARGRG